MQPLCRVCANPVPDNGRKGKAQRRVFCCKKCHDVYSSRQAYLRYREKVPKKETGSTWTDAMWNKLKALVRTAEGGARFLALKRGLLKKCV
jgi:endogenous inhibitor of DNA gyrase (YacG/DUF329 family)